MRKPLTGEPCAGEPHARFGGRGGREPFSTPINAETAALFFYAGHGMQVKGKNYIIPVDAQIETEAAVVSESVGVDTVPEQLNASPAMVAIPGRNYEMGKYEVTQGEWRAVMGGNSSYFSSCGDNCPVEEVSWNDVQEFISKLNQKTGKQYRLPNESEWEYACYGGSQSEYYGGNSIDAVAWYEGNSGSEPHPVG